METLIEGISGLELRITPEQFALTEAAVASMGLADSPRVSDLRVHPVGE
jgi:hypothetical protein